MRWLLFVATLGCSSQRDDASDPNACSPCHLSDYERAPAHVNVKPTSCAVCHSQRAWTPTRKEHPFFALDGAHASLGCERCHGASFAKAAKACAACHAGERASANAKLGWHAKLGAECAECHTTSAWRPSTKHEEPPVATASAATTSATPSATAPASASAKPRPKPHPTAPSTQPSTQVPDIVSRPSWR